MVVSVIVIEKPGDLSDNAWHAFESEAEAEAFERADPVNRRFIPMCGRFIWHPASDRLAWHAAAEALSSATPTTAARPAGR